MMVGMRSWFALAALLVVVAGCGGEEEPYDDGSESSVVVGVTDALAADGAEVVASDTPEDATADDVGAALGTAGLADPTTVDDGLAVDTGAVAGLLATVGEAKRYVVLAFDDPASAAVFAEADRAVFADKRRDDRRTTWFAGNLVAYSDPDAGVDAQLRSALTALAGARS